MSILITNKMETVSAKFAEKDMELMEEFIKKKYFSNRSDLIRTAVRHYLRESASQELMRGASPQPVSKEELKEINHEIKKIRMEIYKREFENET